MLTTVGFVIKEIRELTNSSFALALATLLLASSAAATDIYKCTDADGNLSYSQTPCPEQESVEVDVSGSGNSDAPVDCSYANRFAFSAARLMQAGTRSGELFDRYGGIDSLSKGSINIINYVYGYRSSDDVSAERIAALTQSRCQARSLGDVSCESLPLAYTQGIGGCNPVTTEVDTGARAGAFEQGRQAADGGSMTRATAPRDAVLSGRSEAEVAQCKKRYRDQIDTIDARMRRGYSSEQGEVYREQLIALTRELRRC